MKVKAKQIEKLTVEYEQWMNRAIALLADVAITTLPDSAQHEDMSWRSEFRERCYSTHDRLVLIWTRLADREASAS